MSCIIKMIMQGDSYDVMFKIKHNKLPLDMNQVELIQFQIGSIIKKWSSDGSGEVNYNDVAKAFFFPISQSESLGMTGPQDVQVRIKFSNDIIIGKKYGIINLIFSNNKEVL